MSGEDERMAQGFRLWVEMSFSPEAQSVLEKIAAALPRPPQVSFFRPLAEGVSPEDARAEGGVSSTLSAVPPEAAAAARPMTPRGATAMAARAQWTPERDLYWRQAWPDGVPTAEIMRVLAQLPGPPFSLTARQVMERASHFHLFRPEGWKKNGRAPQARRAPGAPREKKEGVRPMTPRGAQAMAARAQWTPERDLYWRQAWVDGVPTPEIMRVLAQLPGPPFSLSARQVWDRAGQMKLYRPEGWKKKRRRAPQARRAPGAPPEKKEGVRGAFVPALYGEILAWAHGHGLPGAELDLMAVNAKRRALGVAPFRLDMPAKPGRLTSGIT